MADIEKLTIDDTTYDIADAEARSDLASRGKVYYGTCNTADANQVKEVTTSDDFEIKNGVILIVYFSTGNSARPIRLNVNGTGSYSVDQGGELDDYVPNCYFISDTVCEFIYVSGTGWMWVSRSASTAALCNTTLNTSDELNLVGNGVRYSGNDSTTATLSYNTSIKMKGDTLTAGALKTTSGADLDTVNSGLTNGTVTKVGTETVGSGTRHIYLEGGSPRTSASTVGSSTKLVYLSSGTITASTSTVGSETKPVYMNSGAITASSSTVGSGVIPMYLSNGTMTASTSTVGSGTKPVYLSSGTITSSTSTVGSDTKPVYLNVGTLTVSSATVGAARRPVYLSSGTITACTDRWLFGSESITPSAANTPTGVEVTFSTSFGSTPRVFTNASTNVIGTTVMGTSASSCSTTGFQLNLTRTNTTSTTVFWFAIGNA